MKTVSKTNARRFTREVKTGLTVSLLTGALLASTPPSRAQDAPKPADAPAALQTAPQTNPPQTSTPPQKPSEGQPNQTTTAPTAVAPVATPTPPGTVTYSGLIDVYYGINVRAPRAAQKGIFGNAFTGIVTPSGEHIGVDNNGRSFDINDREFSFNLGEFNITRTEGKGVPFGFTATLTTGDTARIVHGTEPGGTSAWSAIQQVFVTKTAHFAKRDIVIDAGIFVTPIGYEVIESTSNDNYSRSFSFQYGTPLYHAGARASLPITPKLQLLGAVVNGWNNIADDNDGKSGIAQLTWKPAANFTGIASFMGGSEGTGAYGIGLAPKNQADITTFLYELQPVYQVNSKLKIAGDAIYGMGSGHTVAAGGGQGHLSGYWTGLAGYARYQVTPRLAVAGRIEQFEDVPGEGGTGLRLGGGYTKLSGTTATLEYTFLRSHLVSRLEYRHDHSNTAFFGSGNGPVREQDTVTASAAYKF